MIRNFCYKTVTQTVTKRNVLVTFDESNESTAIAVLGEIVTDVTVNFIYIQNIRNLKGLMMICYLCYLQD